MNDLPMSFEDRDETFRRLREEPDDPSWEIDKRTPKDHLTLAVDKLRNAFETITLDQAFRFDALRDTIAAMADEQMAVATAPETASIDISKDAEAETKPSLLVPADVRYLDAPAPCRVQLQHPYQRGDVEVRSIEVRPPLYAHVLAVMAGAMRHTEMFAQMTGLPEAEIGALRWPDAEGLVRACHHLMPDLSGV